MPPQPRRRGTLATRIAVLSAAVAIGTALLAGGIGTGLIRSADSDSAQHTLGQLADVAQSVAGRQTPQVARHRLARALRGLHIGFGALQPHGTVLSNVPAARDALDPAERRQVLAGGSISTDRTVDGRHVLVEARPADGKGVILVQPSADATEQSDRAIRLLLLALLIAAVAAVLVGLGVAWRLARPLRRAAAAARSVAAGNRDVALPDHGPAEVVEVSAAVTAIAGALRASEERQQQFLMSVSHDLRTPLTAISGYAESMADGVVDAEDVPHVGSVLLAEAQRLERMVGDLLDLARLGAADFRVELAVVDVVELARSAEPVWESRCAVGDVRFVLEVPPGPLLAVTDGARLRQLLDGLFDNALRVTPAGAPIVLSVRTDERGAYPADAHAGDAYAGGVVAEVRDGGPGLSDDDLAVAFEQGVLHSRYRGVRQVGTGLGLAIARALARRMGASVEAGHAPEGGARFTVHLPRP